MSDHFINGTAKANIYLSLLFRSIINHGIIPESMLLGTIVRIPKNRRGSMNDSSNYRAITPLELLPLLTVYTMSH